MNSSPMPLLAPAVRQFVTTGDLDVSRDRQDLLRSVQHRNLSQRHVCSGRFGWPCRRPDGPCGSGLLASTERVCRADGQACQKQAQKLSTSTRVVFGEVLSPEAATFWFASGPR